MKRITKPLILTVGLAAFLVGAGNAMAQGGGGGGGGGGGRGNFDPAQFAQMRLDRAKESLEVTNDDEWKVLQPLVQKVFDAEAAVPRGMRGGRRGGPGGGSGGGAGGAGGARFGGTPSPEVQALQAAIEAKASPDELKAKLAKLRDTRKEKEAALTKVQEDLRKVLTVRQEASAVLMGLLQ
ncbi:MAG: hypothetical protein ABSA97_03195 [Verrucomicrobiia bacterium]